MAETVFDPIYICDCFDEQREEHVGPVIFPNPATGDKVWQCTACFKRPLFRGWRPREQAPPNPLGDEA